MFWKGKVVVRTSRLITSWNPCERISESPPLGRVNTIFRQKEKTWVLRVPTHCLPVWLGRAILIVELSARSNYGTFVVD